MCSMRQLFPSCANRRCSYADCMAINKMVLVKRYYNLKETLRLGGRDCLIFEYRYGLCDGRTHTFKEIASWFGISGTRVRQLMMRTTDKLRSPKGNRTPVPTLRT
ncbi:MAG: hypothetical protein HYT13_02880 [Candidatus Liptonbacteria bacterium]|nr:hypothetical protein [Candidatus Liptonbacteria bacterium]